MPVASNRFKHELEDQAEKHFFCLGCQSAQTGWRPFHIHSHLR